MLKESIFPVAVLSTPALNVNFVTNKFKKSYPYFLLQVSDSSLLIFKRGQAQPMDGFTHGVGS